MNMKHLTNSWDRMLMPRETLEVVYDSKGYFHQVLPEKISLLTPCNYAQTATAILATIQPIESTYLGNEK